MLEGLQEDRTRELFDDNEVIDDARQEGVEQFPLFLFGVSPDAAGIDEPDVCVEVRPDQVCNKVPVVGLPAPDVFGTRVEGNVAIPNHLVEFLVIFPAFTHEFLHEHIL